MAKKSLVIVESPAKAKTIGKYLGSGYEVKACMGHLRDLPKSKIGVDIEHDFEPDYKPIKGKEDIISDLKKSAKKSDDFHCVFWWISKPAGCRPVRRQKTWKKCEFSKKTVDKKNTSPLYYYLEGFC